jgi:hypothetical protein
VISGFRRDVDEICALVGYYAAPSGCSVPTFRDNLSVPSSRVKNSKKNVSSWTSWHLKIGPIGYPETSVQNYHSVLRNIPEERRSHIQHNFLPVSSRDIVYMTGLMDRYMRKVFEVLTKVRVQIRLFWGVTSCHNILLNRQQHKLHVIAAWNTFCRGSLKSHVS